MSEELIRAEGLSKSFEAGESAIDVLQGVDLSIRRGDTVAIVGQSGVGKSTLLHILGILDHPTSGSLRYKGHDVFDNPDGQYLRLFRQLPGGTFLDVTPRAGFGWEGCGSLSIGDHDRDGDLDILVGRSLMRLSAEKREELGSAPALFRNEVGNRNSWLSLRLVGAGPPHGASGAAIGATVLVTANGVTQTRQVMSSLGHAGHQDAPDLHFGLASARRIDRIEVRWPNRRHSVDVLERVPTRRAFVVRERPGEEASWTVVRRGDAR